MKVLQIAYDLARGLEYIHSVSVIHGKLHTLVPHVHSSLRLPLMQACCCSCCTGDLSSGNIMFKTCEPAHTLSQSSVQAKVCDCACQECKWQPSECMQWLAWRGPVTHCHLPAVLLAVGLSWFLECPNQSHISNAKQGTPLCECRPVTSAFCSLRAFDPLLCHCLVACTHCRANTHIPGLGSADVVM